MDRCTSERPRSPEIVGYLHSDILALLCSKGTLEARKAPVCLLFACGQIPQQAPNGNGGSAQGVSVLRHGDPLDVSPPAGPYVQTSRLRTATSAASSLDDAVTGNDTISYL